MMDRGKKQLLIKQCFQLSNHCPAALWSRGKSSYANFHTPRSQFWRFSPTFRYSTETHSR